MWLAEPRNPNAPLAYQWPDAPQIDLQLNIGANPVNEEVHEVELKITVTGASKAAVEAVEKAGGSVTITGAAKDTAAE